MRISIIVALLIILMLLGVSQASASETSDTNTKIETVVKKQFSIFSELFSTSKAEAETAQENTVVYLDPQSSAQENELREIDARTEQILSRWQKKQAHLWKNLPKGKFTINASAYTAAADECGKSDGITSSGVKVAEQRTLACPPNLPFGTKINIEGMGTLVCEDRGGAIKGNHIDIYMETKTEAFAFGRRMLQAEIVD